MLDDGNGGTALNLDGIAGAGGKIGLDLCIGASKSPVSVIIVNSSHVMRCDGKFLFADHPKLKKGTCKTVSGGPTRASKPPRNDGTCKMKT